MHIQYQQPFSKANSVLVNKCFTYSTLNASSNSEVATSGIANHLKEDTGAP